MTDSAEASNLEAPPSVVEDSQLGFANDDEATQSSVLSSSNGESSRRSRNYNQRPLPVEVQHVEIHPSQIIEYEWPLKSGKKYFVQEQLSKVLGVTSFKRKFPDLTRRSMDGAERSYVVEDLKLSESMPAHLLNGMTVLDGPEVHSLMASQYPEIYAEYTRCVAEKIKNEMFEKQRALDELATDKTKLAQLRKDAMLNCAEFNKELNARRQGKAFYDHHTQLIMYPGNRFQKLKPEYTRPAPYPCALVPGQNSNFYRVMKPEELRRLPVKTVVENDDLFPILRREKSPPSVIVTEQEARSKENEAKNKAAMTPSAASATPAPETNNTPIRPSQSRRQSNVRFAR
uniref:PHD finger protein 10 n=1 Tax=Panagrellus redivivus TaxID=6233 RepID=A0A7E4UMU0_PANRE